MNVSPVHTRIWLEEAEPGNAFAARAAYCHGYDVYREMLGRATWADMVYLLFRGQAPSRWQARMLDALAIALANPGPRDPSVHAAMCGGVGGSVAAASLTAALSVGAGQSGGAREVFLAMKGWAACGERPADWLKACQAPSPDMPMAMSDAGWPDLEHPPGFDPHGVAIAGTVQQTLEALCRVSRSDHGMDRRTASGHPEDPAWDEQVAPRTRWLHANHPALADATGMPLAMTGVAAAAFTDLGFDPAQGEMLYLLLRLPGAAAHALEQSQIGFRRFPFPPIDLLHDVRPSPSEMQP